MYKRQYQHIREMQGFYLLRAVLCAAGAVCLIAAHFLRAERRRAEKKLAALTRCVPGEIWWLAAALAVLSMVFSTGFGGYSPFEFWYYEMCIRDRRCMPWGRPTPRM